jgi:sn-glycerol 3-phosphate transport system substrate-binding protein
MKQRKISVLLAVMILCSLLLAVAPSTAQEPMNIEVWIAFVDYRLDWVVDVANKFNEEYPQYNVTIREYTDYEPLLDAYTLAQEQGNPPQSIQLFEVGTQFAIDSGWFRPVAEIIAGREEVNGQIVGFDDIVGVVSAYYTIGGSWSSVPWNTSTPIFYANKNLMDQAGVEAVPGTWQEIEAACEQFQPLVDAGTINGCITWPNHGWFFEQWLAQQNELLVNNGNGREGRPTQVNLTSDAAVNIVQFHKDMYEKGYFVYSGVQRDWSGTVQAFSTQQVPFIMTSSASAGGIVNSARENGFEVLTGRMAHDGEIPWTGNIIGGATMWVTAGDPAMEEATLTFLLYMNKTDNAASWHASSGYVPIRDSAIELLENVPENNLLGWDRETKSRVDIPAGNWFETNPNFYTASEQLGASTVNLATAGAVFGTFVETRNIITQAIEDVMLQGLDPLTRLSQAETEANILLEEYNLLYLG